MQRFQNPVHAADDSETAEKGEQRVHDDNGDTTEAVVHLEAGGTYDKHMCIVTASANEAESPPAPAPRCIRLSASAQHSLR